jgi:hypothetical protein
VIFIKFSFLNVSKVCLFFAFFFSIVFYFIVPGLPNSFILVFIISLFFLRFTLKNILFILKGKDVAFLLITYLIYPLYSVFITTYNDNYDYSFVYLTFLALIYYFALIFIAAFMYSLMGKYSIMKNICNATFAIVFLQALIIATSIALPEFRGVISNFQDPVDVEIANAAITQTRGFALASQQFFGLSITFCLLLVFMAFFIINNYGHRMHIVVFLIGCATSIPAGRTVFIGIGFAFLLVFLDSIRYLKFKKLVEILLVLSLLMLCVFVFADLSSLKGISSWAFEMFINFFNGRGMESSSTNELIKKMLFVPDVETILFGDGLYTLKNGSYYMGTDSGYMRTMLMGGLSSIALIVFDIYLFYRLSKLFKYLGFKSTDILFYTLVIMTLILQIKGEVLGYNVMFHTLPLLLFFILKLYCKKHPTVLLNGSSH